MEAVKETVSGASSAPEAQHASGAPPVSQVTGETLLTDSHGLEIATGGQPQLIHGVIQ